MADVRTVLPIRALTGEAPVWSAAEQRLYWLDIFKTTLNRFDPVTGENVEVPMADKCYALALREGGGAIGSFETGVGLIDTATGAFEIVADIIRGLGVNPNDGKCDSAGRYYTGTMAKDWKSQIGGLWCIDTDRSVRQVDYGVILSNGTDWSPDGKTMYFTDWGKRVIYAWDYDVATGAMANKRAHIRVPEDAGRPDGMTVDADGCLWSAHWDAWSVKQYDPAGVLMASFEVPCQRPTSVAFGGPDLSTLYITSFRAFLSDDEASLQPEAGNLFALETTSRGRLPNFYRG